MEYEPQTDEPEIKERTGVYPVGDPSTRAPSSVVVALVIVLVVAGLGLYYWLGRTPSRPAPLAEPPSPANAAPAPAPAAEPPIELPPLEASDAFIRTFLARLSDHPGFAAWLVPDELVRRFVAAVDNVALGESPRPHLRFLDRERGFVAAERDGGLYVDEASYERYDPVVAIFSSLDTAAGQRLYRQLHPLFEQAYVELGHPAGDFDRAVARAIDRLLATPIPDGEVALAPGTDGYQLADPALEGLTPAQKHFLRLGPDNMRRVAAKLRSIRDALALPPPR